MMPRRIRLSRQKGWRLPPDTVSVARPSVWGNPYRVVEDRTDRKRPWCCIVPGRNRCPPYVFRYETKAGASAKAVALMRLRLEQLPSGEELRLLLPRLRGKHLACYCGPDDPCHADMLIELANAPEAEI